MVAKTRTGLISRRGSKYAISLELSKNFQFVVIRKRLLIIILLYCFI